MTVNWYRPSQCILVSITLSSFLVCFGCLACGYLLHFAPEEPSKDINGGKFTFIPAVCLASVSGLSIIALAFGCCGIVGDSKVVLILFAIVALVVAACLLGSSSAVFTFMLNGKIHDQMKDAMLSQLDKYEAQDGNIFEHIQSNYKCCGVDKYDDWTNRNTTWKHTNNNTDALAPSSCCTNQTVDNCDEDASNFYKQGCLHALQQRMEYTVIPVFGFCVALSLLEVAMATLACYGAMIIKRYQNYDVL